MDSSLMYKFIDQAEQWAKLNLEEAHIERLRLIELLELYHYHLVEGKALALDVKPKGW